MKVIRWATIVKQKEQGIKCSECDRPATMVLLEEEDHKTFVVRSTCVTHNREFKHPEDRRKQ